MEKSPGANTQQENDGGVRAFVAVEVPEEIQNRIAELQRRLGDHHYPVRWVRPEGIHLTLKFLGQVPSANLPKVVEALRRSAQGDGAFEVGVQGFGVFPNLRRPRVLWVGLTGDIQSLKILQESVDREFGKIGFEKEKRSFSPHLTIGRVFEDASIADVAAMSEALTDLKVGHLGSWRVNSLRLMRSQIQRGGAVYTALEEFELD